MKTAFLIFIPLNLIIILPPGDLLVGLGLAMLLDLVSGVAKAVKKDIPRTSEGFRRTVMKFIQYGGAIAIGIILASVAELKVDTMHYQIYQYFSNAILMFIIFIEIKSILENLTEVSPDSDFTRYFLNPIHSLLSFDLKRFVKQPESNEGN